MLIKLKTFVYDYVDEKGNPDSWFVTVKADVDVAKVEKMLSKSLKQPIKLKVPDESDGIAHEFEINKLDHKLDPKTDSIYNSEESEKFNEERKKAVVFEEPLLDIGEKVNHPMFGEGEVVDYHYDDYAKYPEEIRPAPLFAYKIAFKRDEYVDEKGKLKQPTRMFTPQSWNEVINRK